MKLHTLTTEKKIRIAGAGAEGIAAEKFCKKHCPDSDIRMIDQINSPVPDDGATWIISPGIPRDFFSNIPADRQTSGTEIFFDSLPDDARKKVIGISGTKGKSTTTKFCAEMINHAGMRAVAAGNFGLPLLETFDDLVDEQIEYVVAELSSYQLENLRTSPGIAIFLNLSPDHLDRHGSFENYAAAKTNLWRHQHEGDFLIAPEPIGMALMSTQLPGRIVTSRPVSADIFPPESVFRAPHFLENFGCAAGLTNVLGLPVSLVESTAREFRGLPHRLEFFAEKNGYKFFDDSICTNPESAIATVKFFGAKLTAIIVGGQDRGTDYSPLAHALRHVAPEALVVVLESEAAERIVEACDAEDRSLVRVPDFETALEEINTRSDGTVVLCPAAPSYDHYKNFRERGEAWQDAVKNF